MFGKRTQECLDRELGRATWNGDASRVKRLLAEGANVHAGDDYALHIAAYLGHVETIKALLEAGADVHQCKDWALRMAQNCGHTEQLQVVRDAIQKQDALRAKGRLEFERQRNPLLAGTGLTLAESRPEDLEALLREATDEQEQMGCPRAPPRQYVPLPQP